MKTKAQKIKEAEARVVRAAIPKNVTIDWERRWSEFADLAQIPGEWHDTKGLFFWLFEEIKADVLQQLLLNGVPNDHTTSQAQGNSATYTSQDNAK